MKKNVFKTMVTAIMLMAAGGLLYGQFSSTVYDQNSAATTDKSTADLPVGDVSINATDPGGPGDPSSLPIDGITGMLIATGAAIILAAGRKRALSRL